ncbi:TPA: hypothetical protein NV925_000466 [Klebsiella pneumoniae]|nr:hypothetical protein [Klebsiella pneumoniae]HCJ9435432.1 hypothetical protein [Klebsiella pneumoniae]
MLGKKKFFWFLLFFTFNAYANQVWFCPINTDFINSQNSISEWPNAAKNIKVVKLYHGLIYNTKMSILKGKFNTLHALGIKVAIELPVMIESGKKRKKYIEGFENESYVKEIISKLSHNGIAVDYFVMDEPLYFGAYRGRNKTAMTAEEAVESVVKRSIDNIALIKKVYPNAALGLVEPIQLFKHNDFYDYFDLYNNKMKSHGIDIKFVQDDIVWNKFNMDAIVKLYNKLKNNNIDFDIIINASKKSTSNSQWIKSANDNLILMASFFKNNRVGIVFQSWNKHPSKIIPEWDADSHLSQIIFFNRLMQNKNIGIQ